MQMKSELRKLLLSRRNGLTAEYRSEAGKAVLKNTHFLERLTAADSVLCYVNIGSEMPTGGIIDYCLNNDIRIAVPKCEGGRILFRYINGTHDLEPGAFSVPEPVNDCMAAQITPSTVCITPAVCYNENGYRIGYGKGYYDRFFSENKCIKIGLCYEAFITDFSPDENDVAVDMIFTECMFRRLYNG